MKCDLYALEIEIEAACVPRLRKHIPSLCTVLSLTSAAILAAFTIPIVVTVLSFSG